MFDIDNIPYMQPWARDQIKRYLGTDVVTYKEKNVVDLYQQYEAAGGPSSLDETDDKKQAIINGLRFVIYYANLSDLSEEGLDAFQVVPGMTVQAAAAMMASGYESIEDIGKDSPFDKNKKIVRYLRLESCEIYDRCFDNVDLDPVQARELWGAILATLAMMTPPDPKGPGTIPRPP